MSEDIPVFEVTRDTHGCAQFTCPRCGKTNHHGQGDGHRVSHCGCWPNGYRLQTVGGPDGPEISARTRMLCWTPGTDEVALVPWPDVTRRSDNYECSTLACNTDIQQGGFAYRKMAVFVEAVHLVIRDECDPQAVHRALLGLEEYRDGLSDDMPGVNR